MKPESYPRRILLCVTGLSPQIVTETLYALATQTQPPFVPTEIHLVSTLTGAKQAQLSLLTGEQGQFHQLCRDYGLDAAAIRFAADSTFHLIRTPDGQPLDDIRDEADNTAAADVITDVVRRLTADPASAVHASIAGGRKTMGFLLGYAMSLFGRAQDRLSHVLVSSPFESRHEFFFPPRQARVLELPDKRYVETSEARLTLADIPFVRLRDGLQGALLNANASFSAVVAQAQRNLAAPHLTLDPASCRARCGETTLRLTPISFAWLAWFARRALAGLPPLHWKRIGPAEVEAFLAEHKAALNDPLADDEHPLIATRRKEGISKAFFEERASKLKRELSRALGTKAALGYAVQRQGTEKLAGHALGLEPRQIRFGDLEGE